eukprot:UC4_evm5s1590
MYKTSPLARSTPTQVSGCVNLDFNGKYPIDISDDSTSRDLKAQPSPNPVLHSSTSSLKRKAKPLLSQPPSDLSSSSSKYIDLNHSYRESSNETKIKRTKIASALPLSIHSPLLPKIEMDSSGDNAAEWSQSTVPLPDPNIDLFLFPDILEGFPSYTSVHNPSDSVESIEKCANNDRDDITDIEIESLRDQHVAFAPLHILSDDLSSRGQSAHMSSDSSTDGSGNQSPRSNGSPTNENYALHAEGLIGKLKDEATKAKKKTHHQIERRYRESINNRIKELQALVNPKWNEINPDEKKSTKMKNNKAQILKRTIYYIKYLENKTASLIEDNKALKMKLGCQNQDSCSVLEHATQNTMQGQSSSSTPLQGKFQALCCVLIFGCISLSELGTTGPSSTDSKILHSHGRTLASLPDNEHSSVILITAHFLARAFFSLACVVVIWTQMLMLHGDQYLGDVQSSHDNFRAAMKARNYIIAEQDLLKTLSLLGFSIPLPSNSMGPSLYLSLCVQLLRQLLNRIWIGGFLTWLSTWFNPEDTKIYAAGARAGHELHQLMLNTHPGQSFTAAGLIQLYVAIFALNSAEAAGSALEKGTLARIHLALALQLKAMAPTLTQVLSSIYLGCAKIAHDLSSKKIVNSKDFSLHWIFHPDGQNFFYDVHLAKVFALSDEDYPLSGTDHVMSGTINHLGVLYLRYSLSECAEGMLKQSEDDILISKLQRISCDAKEMRNPSGNNARALTSISSLSHGNTTSECSMVCILRAHAFLDNNKIRFAWEECVKCNKFLEIWGAPRGRFEKAIMFHVRNQLLSIKFELYKRLDYEISFSDVSVVTRSKVIKSIQSNLVHFKRLSTTYAIALPQVLLRQAEYRHITGAKVNTTRHLLYQSLKRARSCNQTYIEAKVLLKTSIILNSMMRPAEHKQNLSRTDTKNLFLMWVPSHMNRESSTKSPGHSYLPQFSQASVGNFS